MKWSWRIGRIRGIDIYIHATFWLLILWVLFSHMSDGRGLAEGIDGVVFVLSIFGCIVLHELGHALMARRFGIQTRDITILPIGGVARLERMPDDPRQELAVALAGPAVNLGLAAGLFAWLFVTSRLVPLEKVAVATGPFLERILIANLFLAVFNLIPAFPMDGGRVLRAFLASRMDHARATGIAAMVGQGVALILGFLGLWGNPMLLFIALFVWIGAAQEAGAVQVRSALAGVSVRGAMLTEFETLSPGDPLRRAVDLILAGSQQDFPVLEGERVAGLLTRKDLVAALARRGPEGIVSEAMQREIVPVDPDEPLDATIPRIQEAPARTLPVVSGGRLVGLITSENIAEFLMIQTAIRANVGKPGSGRRAPSAASPV